MFSSNLSSPNQASPTPEGENTPLGLRSAATLGGLQPDNFESDDDRPLEASSSSSHLGEQIAPGINNALAQLPGLQEQMDAQHEIFDKLHGQEQEGRRVSHNEGGEDDSNSNNAIR